LEKTESEIEKLEAKDGDIDDLEAEREEVSDKLSEIQHLLHDKQKEFEESVQRDNSGSHRMLGYDKLEKSKLRREETRKPEIR